MSLNLNHDSTIVHIVEDDANNQWLLMLMITDVIGIKHCKVHTSGHEMISYVNAFPESAPTVILLDLQLPQEDGYHVLERIRSIPALKDACVVACTANVSRNDVERAQAAGFNGFLAKPLEYERFPEQMKNILQGKAVWDMGR